MSEEWTARKIGSFGRVVTGKTPSTKEADNFDGPYPFITIPDLDGRVFVGRAERTLSEKGAVSMRNLLLPANAVMMSCIATIGKCGITTKPSFTNQQINSVICHDDVEPRYLYYCFTQLGHALDAAGGGGSVYTNVSKSRFSDIEVEIPSLPEQRAIAGVLGALDDKIELNRRMNETLEALAQAEFGRLKDENGRMKAVPLPEVIEVNPQRPLRKGEVAPYLDMANMPTRAARALEVYDREFGSGMRFMDGDTLVARITPCLENGKTCFVDFLGDGKVGWGSTEYIVLRPKPPLPPEYAYFLARTEDFRNFAISNMTGTSGRQRVPADSLNHFLVEVPPVKLAERFGQFARTVFAKMKANDEESRTLAALRDALLPKLLSGAVRVDTQKNKEPHND